MSLARLSRELISRPSLQACKQEITFCVSMRPGRIVRPERLPRKYWANLGVATSPPNGEERRELGKRNNNMYYVCFQGKHTQFGENHICESTSEKFTRPNGKEAIKNLMVIFPQVYSGGKSDTDTDSKMK